MSTAHPPVLHPHLLPTTLLGRWSVALLGLCVGSFAVFFLMVAAGQRGGETIFDNWLLTGPIAVAGISATAAALVGLIALVRDRERGLVVLLAIVLGALVTLFFAGELLNGH